MSVCTICSGSFPDSQSFSRHMRDVHLKPCQVCQELKNLLNHHVNTAHNGIAMEDHEEEPEDCYEQQLTDKVVFFHGKALKEEEHDAQTEAPLEEDAVKLEDYVSDPGSPTEATEIEKNPSSAYKKHVVAQEGINGFICELCKKSFTQKGNLRTHIKTVHDKIREHECSLCGNRFISKWKLTFHQKTVHERSETHNCRLCPKSMSTIYNLKRHLQLVHGDYSSSRE